MLILPPRLYTARVIRVLDLGSAEVLIDLDFGVAVSKTVVIDGLDPLDPPPNLRSSAMAVLISAIGGKRVLVRCAPTKIIDKVCGRMYLYDYVNAPVAAGVARPPGLESYHLEVSAFMAFAKIHGYDKTTVNATLSGAWGSL